MSTLDEVALRALLGDADADALRLHQDRLDTDPAYRDQFAQMGRMRRELVSLPVQSLQPGLDARVMARLRRGARPELMLTEMRRQFWRVAVPAMAAAAVLVTFAIRGAQRTDSGAPVTMATWYPISVDPTVNP